MDLTLKNLTFWLRQCTWNKLLSIRITHWNNGILCKAQEVATGWSGQPSGEVDGGENDPWILQRETSKGVRQDFLGGLAQEGGSSREGGW